MPKRPTPESTTPDLTVRERMLLFCVASSTDWQCALGQVDHAYLAPKPPARPSSPLAAASISVTAGMAGSGANRK